MLHSLRKPDLRTFLFLSLLGGAPIGSIQAQVISGGVPNPSDPAYVAWWDANDASTFTFSAGNQVATWTDKVNGVVATTAGTSITRDLFLNGTSTVTFAGNRPDVMTLSSTVTLTMGLDGDASAFVVASTTDSSGQDTLMSAGGNVQFFRQNGSQVRFFKGTNPDPIIAGDTLTADRIRYAEWFGGPGPGETTGTIDYVVDGASLSVANEQNIGTQNWALTTIGGRPPVSGGCCGEWTGDVAEILLFDRALTTDEENAVGAYLADKYGISTSWVAPAPELPFRLDVEASGSDLIFTWESRAGKVYDLLSSTDPEADGDPSTWPVVAGQEGLAATPPENTRTIARPVDATRFYVVRERNAPPFFFDDFESVPNPDWTVGANGGDAGTTAWERGAPTNVGPTSGYDGSTTCFGTNISADFTLNTDIWLRTPPIDLGGGITGATLSFFQHRDTDLDVVVDDDYGTIRVLDANSFAQLGDLIATDIEGFDDDGNGPIWVEFEAMPLPPEAIGEEVVIEFRFKTDNAVGVFAGWYIDNVAVEVE